MMIMCCESDDYASRSPNIHKLGALRGEEQLPTAIFELPIKNIELVMAVLDI